MMRMQPVQEEHHEKIVWVNPTTESLRREECLCLNCGNFKPGQDNHCRIANALYRVCVAAKIALAVTRCPDWKPK